MRKVTESSGMGDKNSNAKVVSPHSIQVAKRVYIRVAGNLLN